MRLYFRTCTFILTTVIITCGLHKIIPLLKTKASLDHIATAKPANLMESGIFNFTISDNFLVYCIGKFRSKIRQTLKMFKSMQFKNYGKGRDYRFN